ncbi:hypothetical protein [Metabacillus dongyingensis]|uniref:hypothetical protein n=1 Tax=Metabacillus dongyingensis TaxID=2874282 RepID=UPI001CC018C3|nr:hypothetical protein [Metabacillus dongyingensis]UAL53092.1 hypothetical protein K8L98_04620 [Metabacillus dongyingensis]
MKTSGESLENILGVHRKARRKNQMYYLENSFKNPIVHREINGDKIYVPLNMERVWNQIS